MSKPHVFGIVLVTSIFAFLLGWLLSLPGQTTRAAAPNARATPTISKRINANLLQNRPAKAFMPTTAASQFVSINTRGMPKAGAEIYCGGGGIDTPLVWFNNVNGFEPMITNNGEGRCMVNFGIDPAPRIILATALGGTGDAGTPTPSLARTVNILFLGAFDVEFFRSQSDGTPITGYIHVVLF